MLKPGSSSSLRGGFVGLCLALGQSAVMLAAMMALFIPFSRLHGRLDPVDAYRAYLLYPVALFLLLWAAHALFHRLKLKHAGFSPIRFPLYFAHGLLVGGASVVVCLWLTARLDGGLVQFLPLDAPAEPFYALLGDVWETGFSEEFLFRGFLLIALLKRGFGTAWALAVSTLLFTAAHVTFDPHWLPAVAATGLFLGTLFLATRSIWATVGCHAAINLTSGCVRNDWVIRTSGLEASGDTLALCETALFLVLSVVLLVALRLRIGVDDDGDPAPFPGS